MANLAAYWFIGGLVLLLIQAGQIATIVLDLDDPIKLGRDAQFKLTTTNGAIIVHTVDVGHQSG